MIFKLDNIFKPKFYYDLRRIGSNHDGGYLIENSSLENAEFLISFGISTNWDFEKDFIKYKNINFLAFDGSIDEKFGRKMKKKHTKNLKGYLLLDTLNLK